MLKTIAEVSPALLGNFCDANCVSDQREIRFDDGYAETAPIGSYPGGVSWVGALDMSGNVWEWVSSIYSEYPYDATDGREADGSSDSSSNRARRGGSWASISFALHATSRGLLDPVGEYDFVGLRCARSY